MSTILMASKDASFSHGGKDPLPVCLGRMFLSRLEDRELPGGSLISHAAAEV